MPPLPKALVALALLFLLLAPAAAPGAAEDGTSARSKGQRVYLPIYSTIRYRNDEEYGMAVTISLRNVDPDRGLTVISAGYYGNDGAFKKDLLEAPLDLAPLASEEFFIRQADLRGDIGANLLIEWKAEAAVLPPLVEAVMVGSKGTQGIAFTSRGVVLGP